MLFGYLTDRTWQTWTGVEPSHDHRLDPVAGDHIDDLVNQQLARGHNDHR